MKRISFVILAVFSALSFAGTALASDEAGVRASYYGTTDMPDEIAFQLILGVFQDDRPEMIDLMASVLKVPLNDDTRVLMLERLTLFREARKSIQNEGKDTSYEMLCSETRGARTKEDTYEVLNDVDDVRESIAKKHYLLTISALSTSERQAFQTFLNEKKTGMSYAKVDSRADREEWQDIRTDVEQQCNMLAARRGSD